MSGLDAAQFKDQAGGNGKFGTATNWKDGSGNAGVPGTSDTAEISTEVLEVTGPTTIGTLKLHGGGVAGTGTLTIAGTGSEWTGGTMNSGGALVVSSDADLSISGDGNLDFDQHAITNQGTTNWAGGNLRSGNGGAVVITNDAGATFNDQTASDTSYITNSGFGGSMTFTNNGTYHKSGAGNTQIDGVFDNNADVVVNGGTLLLSGGGSSSGSGQFNTASGARTVFGSDFSVSDASALKGNGQYELNNGTLSLDGAVDGVGKFSQTGGTLSGSQSFDNTGIDWTDGNWNSDGSTTLGSTVTLNLSGGAAKDFNGRAVLNNGTVNWSDGEFRSGNGGSFTNESGAAFNDQNASNNFISNSYYGGSMAFTNNGAYNKSGAGVTEIQIPAVNNGTIHVNAGTLRFTNAYTQSGGIIRLGNSASIEFTSGLTLGGGTLHGNGYVHADVQNRGVISAGDVLGRLDISGNLTLSSDGTVLFDIGGTEQGVTYDLIVVSGAIALGGNIELSLTPEFRDSILPTDTFTVLEANSLSGTFANAVDGSRIATIDNYGTFLVNYGTGDAVNSIILRDFALDPIPEPSTYALMALGLLGTCVRFLRRRR